MISLKIFIPTYKRQKTLFWSLDSVLRQNFENQSFNREIIIMNNDESSFKDVEEVLKEVLIINPNHKFHKIELIQGNKNLVEKNLLLTYETIFKKCQSNDIAIVHCDDDIMLPNTLLRRYNQALNSELTVFIEKFISPAYFFQNNNQIYFNQYQYDNRIFKIKSATSSDLLNFSIPFLSVYTYKVNDTFKEIYKTAVNWADEIHLEQKIKYPFIPFYIGLSSYFHKKLGTAENNIVIRGTLFKNNCINYPRVETEYANTGIILLTGLFVLKNKHLNHLKDFELLRKDFEKTISNFLLVTLFRKDGVSFSELKRLLSNCNYSFDFKTYLNSISFKSIRNLFNNLIFDSRYIKRYLIGWGPSYNSSQFWEKLNQ